MDQRIAGDGEAGNGTRDPGGYRRDKALAVAKSIRSESLLDIDEAPVGVMERHAKNHRGRTIDQVEGFFEGVPLTRRNGLHLELDLGLTNHGNGSTTDNTRRHHAGV